MALNHEKTQQKIKRMEVQLQKAIETRKRLETELKELRAKEEKDRLCSRGKILEKYLRKPLLLTDREIDELLEIMFRSSFTKQKLDALFAAKDARQIEPIKTVNDESGTINPDSEQYTM